MVPGGDLAGAVVAKQEVGLGNFDARRHHRTGQSATAAAKYERPALDGKTTERDRLDIDATGRNGQRGSVVQTIKYVHRWLRCTGRKKQRASVDWERLRGVFAGRAPAAGRRGTAGP